jgi:hypothetical protein
MSTGSLGLPFRHKIDEQDQIYELHRRVIREHVEGFLQVSIFLVTKKRARTSRCMSYWGVDRAGGRGARNRDGSEALYQNSLLLREPDDAGSTRAIASIERLSRAVGQFGPIEISR